MSRDMPKGRRGGHMGMPGGVVEKAKNFKSTWIKLIAYCRRYLPVVAAALILAVIGTIFQIIGPDKIKDITNEISNGLPGLVDGQLVPGTMNLDVVFHIGLVLIGFYSISFICNLLQNWMMAGITQQISRDLRRNVVHKINKMPLRYFDKNSHGDILSRITNDVDTIGQALNQSISSLVTATTTFVGSIVMMLYTNWILALTAISTSLLGFFLLRVIMSRSQKYFARQQQELGKVNGHIEEIYSSINVVKVYNAAGHAKEAFEGINDALYKSAWLSQFLSGLMMPIMNFVGNFGYVAVCIVGAALAMTGHIGFGVIVAFTLYVRLFTNPLSQLAQATQNLQRTAASAERVFEILEQPELEKENDKIKLLDNVKGNVEFRHVHFGYVPEKTIINNFSASIQAGQKIAIVGPTGAGKTTMVNLLMRFYELGSGEIRIDDVPIQQTTRENLHDQFCMVLQDTWLFEGTIKENIIFSKQGVTDEAVVDACKAVGLHHFIATLPDGYDTVLSEKGSLSQGEKQLLTIARAMIQNAPMLILDEATSSVDTRKELIIQQAMDRLMKGRTSFVIAHRLSTIKDADIILVMKDGDILESGNHEALLEKQGFYAELYNSQFEQAS